MKYSREQLIKAQMAYNNEFLKNPKDFADHHTGSEEESVSQIDYLLSLVDK